MSRERASGPPRRQTSTAAVVPEYLLFVEGLRTEDLYLTHWRRQYRDRIRIEIHPFRGGPMQLVEKAVAAQQADVREARNRHGRPYDQIWCVFDRDEHPKFDAAIDLASRHGINLAISNPCLELWFILHFEDQTAYLERNVAQRRADDHLGCSKVLTDAALTVLAARYDEAPRRAIKLDEKHAGDGSPSGSNPSSRIWRLIDLIRLA